jgi:hypothetical protein
LVYPAVTLEPDEAMATIFCSEAPECSFSVFSNAAFKIICDAYIEGAARAGYDLGVIDLFPRCHDLMLGQERVID